MLQHNDQDKTVVQGKIEDAMSEHKGPAVMIMVKIKISNQTLLEISHHPQGKYTKAFESKHSKHLEHIKIVITVKIKMERPNPFQDQITK